MNAHINLHDIASVTTNTGTTHRIGMFQLTADSVPFYTIDSVYFQDRTYKSEDHAIAAIRRHLKKVGQTSAHI